MPQVVLATWLRITRERLSRVERGKAPATVAMLCAAIECFDANPLYLIGHRETPERGMVPREDERALLAAYNELSPAGRKMAVQSIVDLKQVERALSASPKSSA